eukprot:scaffold1518_cov417-Prasinococcus_capsulatus_cf.AAC.30
MACAVQGLRVSRIVRTVYQGERMSIPQAQVNTMIVWDSWYRCLLHVWDVGIGFFPMSLR